MGAESKFERSLVRHLKGAYPGAIILKNDSSQQQGIPDRLILIGDRWAAFEVKASENSPLRPNQAYFVRRMNQMSYAKLVNPENVEEFLRELQQALRP